MGWTQEELAEKVGVDRTTIVRWESGGSITDRKLVQMRDLFGCDVDWILGLSDECRAV
jgi:transcriptional regulator with XRE-family HTH domain